MIGIGDIVEAVIRGDVPLPIAVELSSDWDSVWNSSQNDAGHMCELLQLTGSGPTAKTAIEAAEVAADYFELRDPPYRWKKEALRVLRDGAISNRFADIKSLAQNSAYPYYRMPTTIGAFKESRRAIFHALSAVSYTVRRMPDLAAIDACTAISCADDAFTHASNDADIDKIIDLIKRRFKQPTVHQIIAAARERR